MLEASYEATLLAALKQAEKHGYAGSSNVVYLTMLGGGVFGNDVNWILESIHKACISVQECDLDVRTTLTCPHAHLPPVQMVGGSFDAVFCAEGNHQLCLAPSLQSRRHGVAAVLRVL